MIRSFTATILGAAVAMNIGLAAPPAPRIVILGGPPGSGKTTQAKFLAKKYGIPAFSMADLLKKEMSAGKKDAVSKTLAAAIATGEVLPDEQALDLIRQRLFRTDGGKGFILDGFPSTAGQAKTLDAMLADASDRQEEVKWVHQLPRAVVVVLEAPDDVIRKPMLARGRADDKPEIIDRRIQDFRREASLLAGWVGQTRVVRVNSSAGVSQASTQIVSGLEDVWSKQTSQ